MPSTTRKRSTAADRTSARTAEVKSSRTFSSGSASDSEEESSSSRSPLHYPSLAVESDAAAGDDKLIELLTEPAADSKHKTKKTPLMFVVACCLA